MAIEGVQLWEDGPVYAKEPIYYEDNKDDGAVFLVGTETDPTGETMYLDYNGSSLSRGNYNTLSIYCEQPKKRMNILKILRFHDILPLIICSYQFRSFRHVISFNEVDSHV